MTPEFWYGKRILITGHTGFKGVWATQLLARLGAEVHGVALAPDNDLSLFEMLGEESLASSTIGDITDRNVVSRTLSRASPQIVLHMAAQSLVRRSYRNPVETFATNVMGTVHLLNELRSLDKVEAVLVVTTDKVYENQEESRPFVEGDRLGGHDPYSASKAAAEMAVAAFNCSYFSSSEIKLATARGGNVIGGGDFSEDRLVPDMVRAELSGTLLKLRNPQATRPWQHVLDCLAGYITYLEALAKKKNLPCALNFGPTICDDNLTVAQVQTAFAKALGIGQGWEEDVIAAQHEAQHLSINSQLAKDILGWDNRYSSSEAIRMTAEWYKAWRDGADPRVLIEAQIDSYLKRDGHLGEWFSSNPSVMSHK